MEDSALKKYSLSSQVCEKLEKLIENNIYKIDEKIPTEAALAAKFKVSRNTIREAIKQMAAAGILEVRQGDGTYVRANNRFDAFMSIMLKGIRYADVNETRKTLEISICYYAALRRTDSDLEAIKKALQKRQEEAKTQKEATMLDVSFHMAIARSAHNTLLLDLYKSLYTYLFKNIAKRKIDTEYTIEEIDAFHIELYEAIKMQDGKKAQEVARKILNI